MAEPLAYMARAMREQLGDHVLATFEATIMRLNDLLAGVGPHAWERPCYHPWRLMPVQQFLAMSLQELVLHGWDIHSRLALESLPALLELIATSRTSGFLHWAFRPGPRLSAPVRYHFAVTGTVPSRVDMVVEGDHAYIAKAGDMPASVTFHCDTETYVLVMYGRRSLETASAMGRLRIKGDQALVAALDSGSRAREPQHVPMPYPGLATGCGMPPGGARAGEHGNAPRGGGTEPRP